MTLLSNFWDLFLVSAPWLMLGLLLAGLLNVFIPKNFLQKHLGKEGVWTTIKAALIGAPMPLCSCGVIPAAVGLRRAGGSKSATTAFLVSTPETGVDSVSVSYVLLGPFMAVMRPIAAVSSAIVAGLLVGKEKAPDNHCSEAAESDNKSEETVSSCCAPKHSARVNKVEQPAASSCCATKQSEKQSGKQSNCGSKTAAMAMAPKSSCCSTKSESLEVGRKEEATQSATSCCGSKPKAQMPSEKNTEVAHEPTSSCCSVAREESVEHEDNAANAASSCCDNKKDTQQADSFFTKVKQAVSFSCNKLLSDTMSWLMIGLFFAALVQTYVPTSFLSQWGDGILAMVVVILVSIPMYICATASTPIAAGLLMAGVSPGAVLVFMLAGPATNIATLGVVATELGKRAVGAYLAGVIGVAIAFGFLTDYLVEQFGFTVNPAHGMEHELMPSWLTHVLGIILLILMLRLVLISLKQRLK